MGLEAVMDDDLPVGLKVRTFFDASMGVGEAVGKALRARRTV